MNKIIKFFKEIWRMLFQLFARRIKKNIESSSNKENSNRSSNSNSSSNSRKSSNASSSKENSRTTDDFKPKIEKTATTEVSQEEKKPLRKRILSRTILRSVFGENSSETPQKALSVVTNYTDAKNVRIIREDFNSIGSLVKCLRTRPHNPVMRYCNSSESINIDRKSFTGTSSYTEAENLLLAGYVDILPKLQKCTKKVNILKYDYIKDKSHPTNTVVGGVANVPRALMGLPNNLINREHVVKRVKTLSIVYDISVPCAVSAEDIIEGGVTLLSAINLIELSGVQLRLIACFFSTDDDDSFRTKETLIGTVPLKDFSEKFNILKMCFPLAHPSMLRRIGFKFLETSPGITSSSFRMGYGTSVDDYRLREIFEIDKKTVFISLNMIHGMNYNVEKLVKYIEDYVK